MHRESKMSHILAQVIAGSWKTVFWGLEAQCRCPPWGCGSWGTTPSLSGLTPGCVHWGWLGLTSETLIPILHIRMLPVF